MLTNHLARSEVLTEVLLKLPTSETCCCVVWVVHVQFLMFQITIPHFIYSGPGSVVGIANGYWPDGPGIESRWGARFSASVQTGPGVLYNGCRVFPGGKERLARHADPSTPCSAVVKKE